MSRTTDVQLLSTIQAEKLDWAYMLALHFEGDPVYVWSGSGDLTWDGKTWIGTGDVGSLSGVSETDAMSNTVIEATLSHLEPEHLQEIINFDPVGRSFDLHLAFFENDQRSPYKVLTLTAGVVDGISVVDGQVGMIKLKLVSEMALMRRFHLFRMDDQHQQYLFPGDKGCEYVTSLDEEIIWGPRPNKVGGNGGSGEEIPDGFTHDNMLTEHH